MIKYGQLDLKKIMADEDLDFARWTYSRGQCSCCYGPLEMPAKYWKDHKKPKIYFLDDKKQLSAYQWPDGTRYNSDNTRYILFKNACNGSGTVTEDDIIRDYTCIGYRLKDMDQVRRIADMISEQLDDDYVVQCPDNMLTCIVIRVKERLENGY